jgi:cation transport ATPase
LEAVAAVEVVIFDKTGTLTFGAPDVRAITPAPGVESERLLGAAAMAERRSEHPLGTAIVSHAQSLGIMVAEPETFAYTPGRGMRALFEGLPILVGNASLLAEEGLTVPAASGVGTRTD